MDRARLISSITLSNGADFNTRSYERGSMLVTSNRSVVEWDTVFGDAVVATAILDRMLHHSHVITIRGDSYRLRSKRRSGLLNQGSPAAKTAH